jgi:hypothetical protein
MPWKKNNPGNPCCEEVITCRGCPNGAPPYLLLELIGIKAGGFFNTPDCELYNGTYILEYGGESGTGSAGYLCNYYGGIPCKVQGPYGEITLPCYPCNSYPDSHIPLRGILQYNMESDTVSPDTWRAAISDQLGSAFAFEATGPGALDCLNLNELVLPKLGLGGTCCDQTEVVCKISALR